jgi:hypothetical protein
VRHLYGVNRHYKLKHYYYRYAAVWRLWWRCVVVGGADVAAA